ncbi:MAG TPA: radical SAM protein [Candidatus Brocadiia bacterium]|nr:radical SAM protein [Candidatus Brocadiia bacterium]
MRVGLVYRGRYHVREALDLEGYAPLLRGAGHRVRLFWDEDVFGVTDNVLQVPWLAKRLSNPLRMAWEMAADRPEVLVFSVLPSTFAWCCEVAKQVKARTGAAVVFAGLHAALAAERCMREACVDCVIQGEAEPALAPLMSALAGRGRMADVGNLWRRDGGEVRFTFRAPLADLDALPLPDKELFRPAVSHAYSYCAMVSRGCPYQCSFCEETCCKRLYGAGYFRRKKPETVLRELVEGKRRYGFREVIFKDSYLSGSKAWLEELMRGYRREIGRPFKCFCTIAGFDADTARLLKEGGCYNVEFGLQTWNDRLRRETLNRGETSEMARRVFDLCARYRLWFDVDHMFNLPGETEGDHLAGAREYGRLRYLNRIKNHFLVYLPGAEIVSAGKAAGALPPDIERQLEDGLETDFYGQEWGSAGERATVAGFAALYKLLPPLPAWLLEWLLRGRRWRWLGRAPGWLMALAQGALALRSRDLRFAEYVRSYPRKALRGLRRALGWGCGL